MSKAFHTPFLIAQTLYNQFKSIVATLGLPEARFHDLRHTYAVSAIQSGDDIKTVQENLGHHTAAFTLDVYGRVTEKMKLDSAARMQQSIKEHYAVRGRLRGKPQNQRNKSMKKALKH